MLFSTLRRGASTSWPQPVHRRRMSIPTRSTSHRRPAAGVVLFQFNDIMELQVHWLPAFPVNFS